MNSGFSTMTLAIACFVVFLLSGGLGILIGWFVRGWKNLKLRIHQDKLLSETKVELTKAVQALALKTRDLNSFKTISKAEIDRLRGTASTQNGPAVIDSTKFIQAVQQSNLGEVDLSDSQQHPLDEKRQETRRASEKRTENIAALAMKCQAELQNRGQTGGTSGEHIEEGDSATDFFNTNFAANESKGNYFQSADVFSVDHEQLKDQERVIVKLVEKGGKLEAEVAELQSINHNLLLAAKTKLKSGVGTGDGKAVNIRAMMVGQLKNAQSILLSREQELNKFKAKTVNHLIEIGELKRELKEQKLIASRRLIGDSEKSKSEINDLKNQLKKKEMRVKELEPQLEKINGLTCKLQKTDKLNVDLQIKAVKIPLLEKKLSQAETAVSRQDELSRKLNSLNKIILENEEQNTALQCNNAKLRADNSELKQQTIEIKINSGQQIVEKQLFEKKNIDLEKKLQQEQKKIKLYGSEAEGYKYEIRKLQEENAKLTVESLDRREYADQLDTLNLQLGKELKKQKATVQAYVEKQAQFENSTAELENEIANQQSANQKLKQYSIEKNGIIDKKSASIVFLKSEVDKSSRVKGNQAATIQQLKRQLSIRECQLSVQEKQVTDHENQKISQEKQIVDQEGQIAVFAKRLSGREEQLSNKATKIVDLENTVTNLQKFVDVHEKQKSGQLKQINEFEKQIADRQKQFERQKKISTELEKTLLESKYTLEQSIVITKYLSSRVTSLMQVANMKKNVENEIQKLKKDVVDSSVTVKSLNDKIVALKHAENERDALRNQNRLLIKEGVESQEVVFQLHSAEKKLVKYSLQELEFKSVNLRLESLLKENGTLKKRLSMLVKSKIESAKIKSKTIAPKNVTHIKRAGRSKQTQVKDDLKLIHGVGPKLEKLLNKNGITTFRQIAEFDEKAVEELALILGAFHNRIRRDNWVGSAKNLSEQQLKKVA